MTAQQCLDHQWLASDTARLKTRKIDKSNLKRFMARRKWQVSNICSKANQSHVKNKCLVVQSIVSLV